MMSYITRRKFLRLVGGLGMVLGTHPWLGLPNSDFRLSFEKIKARPAIDAGLLDYKAGMLFA